MFAPVMGSSDHHWLIVLELRLASEAIIAEPQVYVQALCVWDTEAKRQSLLAFQSEHFALTGQLLAFFQDLEHVGPFLIHVSHWVTSQLVYQYMVFLDYLHHMDLDDYSSTVEVVEKYNMGDLQEVGICIQEGNCMAAIVNHIGHSDDDSWIF